MLGSTKQRLVVVESPYAGEVEANVAYAKKAILDCLKRGEAPIASHLLFTQDGILNDADPIQRSNGIAAGHAWIERADAVVVYEDRGISNGMAHGIVRALKEGTPVEFRKIGPSEVQKDEKKTGAPIEASPASGTTTESYSGGVSLVTKFGSAIIKPNNDPLFVNVLFAKKVALNGGVKTREWILSRGKMADILGSEAN